MMAIAQVAVLLMVLSAASPSAIPIWELLNYEEKLDYLMKMLGHLVTDFCKNSHDVPECKRTVSSLGISNLLSFDDDTINLLDPYQRDSRNILWNAAIRSVIKLPPSIHSTDSTHRRQEDTPQDYQRLDKDSYQSLY